MSTLNELIKKYQLTSFFIFTNLFTWLLFLPFLLTGDEQTFGVFVILGLFGPAIINIYISRLISSEPSDNKKQIRNLIFFIVWIISTTVFTLQVATSSGIQTPIAIVFFAILGLLPAYVYASSLSKYKSVSTSLISLLKPKGHFGYYMFALLMPPVIKLISMPLSNFLNLNVLSEPSPISSSAELIGIILVSFAYGFFFTGGLNEEVGWTGFALPRLQRLVNPFTASIILWFFWILWHIPFQITGVWNAEMTDFIRALVGTFFARFILTWLFIKTRGGILAAMILHVSANVSFMVLPATYLAMFLEAIIAIYLVIKGKMWEKLPSDSPAVFIMQKEKSQ